MIKTTCREIAEWWYAYAIRLYDSKKLDKAPPFVERLLIDPGEPNCWGCDLSLEGDYIKGITKWSVWDNYNHLKIDRCHIIPASRGGSDRPNNLLLMCRSCHEAMPDTVNPKHVFTWLNNRPKQRHNETMMNLERSSNEMGLTVQQGALLLFMDDLFSRIEERKYRDFIGHYGTGHFGVFKYTTELLCTLEYTKKNHSALFETFQKDVEAAFDITLTMFKEYRNLSNA